MAKGVIQNASYSIAGVHCALTHIATVISGLERGMMAINGACRSRHRWVDEGILAQPVEVVCRACGEAFRFAEVRRQPCRGREAGSLIIVLRAIGLTGAVALPCPFANSIEGDFGRRRRSCNSMRGWGQVV